MSRRNELKTEILRRLLLYGKATRPELVALTGRRAATVFETIDALKAEGIVGEPERRGKKTGRRAPELFCVPEYCCTIGVELRVSGCCGVIINTAGEVLHHLEINSRTPNKNMPEARREILALLQRLREMSGDLWEKVRGIGFADPGLVDLDSKRSIRAVNIPGWENLATGEWLSKASGLPAMLWPEAMVKTRMEYLTRLPNAPRTLFHLGTDDGIGGGFIQDGKLFAGSTGRGMEIGHVVVSPDGARCQCGNSGCLEAVSGIPAIEARVSEAYNGGVDLPFEPSEFTMEKFCASIYNCKGTRIIADEICRHIGSALAVAVALLNPEVIVISGVLAGLGELLPDAVRRELELKCFPDAVKELKIELSKLQSSDTARGAAIMMRDTLLIGSAD